jgi:ferredoxin
MRGVICYYSGTGNTRLACEYVARHVQAVTFDLLDITGQATVDLAPYEVVGFACFADFWGPSQLMGEFIARLPRVSDKLAFALTTHGGLGGPTLRLLRRLVQGKGFRVVGGHALHTPENYPPMIARGATYADAPSPRELAAFSRFVAALEQHLAARQRGDKPLRVGSGVGLLELLLPAFPRSKARKDMGRKYVDEALCTECGLCREGCPYGAITLDPKPIFNQDKCWGCWRCYSRCPQQAIYTAKLRGKAQRPHPLEALREKLGQ